jgi:hypothetical protein
MLIDFGRRARLALLFAPVDVAGLLAGIGLLTSGPHSGETSDLQRPARRRRG